jgi:hypothetical protein
MCELPITRDADGKPVVRCVHPDGKPINIYFAAMDTEAVRRWIAENADMMAHLRMLALRENAEAQ